jgi:hypothetical protein
MQEERVSVESLIQRQTGSTSITLDGGPSSHFGWMLSRDTPESDRLRFGSVPRPIFVL